MAPAATTSKQFVYFDDLQAHLGGIPAHRIRLVPTPGEATEEDVLRVHAREGRVCELIDGVLVEKGMATGESRLAAMLIFFIETYLQSNPIGGVLAPDGYLLLFPGQVRAADVSFISWKNMPGGRFPKDAIAPLTPELAVEILSKSNTAAEMKRKLKEYFLAGTQIVWYVDPEKQTVRVYSGPRRSVLLEEGHVLTGGKVLPGFTLSIRHWFETART